MLKSLAFFKLLRSLICGDPWFEYPTRCFHWDSCLAQWLTCLPHIVRVECSDSANVSVFLYDSNIVSKWPIPASFWFIYDFFQTMFVIKTLDFSGNQTQNIREDDHFTTTVAHKRSTITTVKLMHYLFR